MSLNFKKLHSALESTDYLLQKRQSQFDQASPWVDILYFDSSLSSVHPAGYLDIISGHHPTLLSNIGGKLSLRNHQYYSFFYLLHLEIFPREKLLVIDSGQINLKEHTEFESFNKFYVYFYAQKVFYWQCQFKFI